MKTELNIKKFVVSGDLNAYFSHCCDNRWNVSNKTVNKTYNLGHDEIDTVLSDVIEGKDCNIVYMLPHIYKASWKNFKKLPYIDDIIKRTDLKKYKNDIVDMNNSIEFVYRDKPQSFGPINLVDKRTGKKINLLFVRMPYICDDVNDIVSARKLNRALNNTDKAMDWTKYTDVFKHYAISTGFSAGQTVRAYLVTIALAFAMDCGMLEVVIPSCDYIWSLLENDITNNTKQNSVDVVTSGWINAINYCIDSCDSINKGFMDIHIVGADSTSDESCIFNYDLDSVYPAPVHFTLNSSKSKSKTTIEYDEPKKTEALDDVKVMVDEKTIDEKIEKASKKKNLD